MKKTDKTLLADCIMLKREASDYTGVSLTSMDRKENPRSPYYDPTFPERIPLGDRPNSRVGYRKSKLDAWLERQRTIRGIVPDNLKGPKTPKCPKRKMPDDMNADKLSREF